MSDDVRDDGTGAEEEDMNREVESSALFAATRGLEDCLREWSPSGPDHRLIDALRFNLRLWTLFQCDLSRSHQEFLPRLRVDLLSRCDLVDRRTFEIIAEPTSDGLQSLIEINRGVPAGLPAVEDPPSAGPAAHLRRRKRS
jgi:flagellar protein FlaF